jgi:hypothetical protein
MDSQVEINADANSAPAKPLKGAMILLKETEGGLNILVNFLDENGNSTGGEFDQTNFVHAIAKAAPIIIGEIADDFKGAVGQSELLGELNGMDAPGESAADCGMTFAQWWDEEAREFGIDTDQADSREIAELAWSAALSSKPSQSAQAGGMIDFDSVTCGSDEGLFKNEIAG